MGRRRKPSNDVSRERKRAAKRRERYERNAEQENAARRHLHESRRDHFNAARAIAHEINAEAENAARRELHESRRDHFNSARAVVHERNREAENVARRQSHELNAEEENAARRELHESRRDHFNAARAIAHEINAEAENAARRELHESRRDHFNSARAVVHERNREAENVARRQSHELNAEEENAARRELHESRRDHFNAARAIAHEINAEAENAARRELHESRRDHFNSARAVVHERNREAENVARRQSHELNAEEENAARRELHESRRDHFNAARAIAHEINAEAENAARRELHESRRDHFNSARAVAHERNREAENVTRRQSHELNAEEENAVRRELHESRRDHFNAARAIAHEINAEAENAARRELHESRRDHFNAVRALGEQRRLHDLQVKRGEFNIIDPKMELEDFVEQVRAEGQHCFQVADCNPINALALWYANMGSHMFGQGLQFRNPPPTMSEMKLAALPDVEAAQLKSEHVFRMVKEFDKRHKYYPERLPGCSACGVTSNTPDDCSIKYQCVSLKSPKLAILELTEEQLEKFSAMQSHGKTVIPVDESFHLAEIQTTDVISCYRHEHGKYYHLHPELVSGAGDSTRVTLCPTCYNDIMKKGVLPKNSIANGIDFGVATRIRELTSPNFSERQIISRMRLFEQVLKIRSNTRGSVDYTHYQIRAHSVIIPHDAPERSLEGLDHLITEERLESLFSMIFVGPKGEMDILMNRCYGTSTIFARPYVVIQWLLLLEKINPYYRELPDVLKNPTSWSSVQAMIERANKYIMDSAERVTDETEVMREEHLGTDIAANSRGTAAETAVPDDTIGNEEVPFRYSLLTREEFPQSYDVCRQQQLDAISRHLFPPNRDVDTENPMQMDDEEFGAGNWSPAQGTQEEREEDGSETAREELLLANGESNDNGDDGDDGEDVDDFQPIPISFRQAEVFRDLENQDATLSAAFPYVFLLGCAYHRSVQSLNIGQTRHLMGQFHHIPAKDRHLLAYVFDSRRRAQTLYGVKVLAMGNNKAYKEVDSLVNAPDFQEKLEKATKAPDAKESRDLLKSLHNCLSIAGRKQALGSHELRSVAPSIKEMAKTMGPPSVFLTVTFDLKNNPRAFMLSKAIVSNDSMPACLPETDVQSYIDDLIRENAATQERHVFGFPCDEASRAKEAINSPFAYVEEYVTLATTLLSVVLGLPPENFFNVATGKSSRKSTYVQSTTAFGRMLSYYGVTEANNRGDLHFHLVCFGSLPPYVLTRFATSPEMRTKIADVLQSYYTTQLDRTFLTYKVLKDILIKRRRQRFPTFELPKGNKAHLLTNERAKLAEGLNHNEALPTICSRTQNQGTQQAIHDHLRFTCGKGLMGKIGCRYCRPFILNNCCNVVCLMCRKKDGRGRYDPEDGGIGDECWIVRPVVDQADTEILEDCSPLDVPINNSVYYWDMARPWVPPMESPFQLLQEYYEGSVVFTEPEKDTYATLVAQAIMEDLPEDLQPDFEEMKRIGLRDLVEIFLQINRDITEMNGRVVEHSPVISYVTGSHNNAAHLGSAEQGKGATFYLGPYLEKAKFSLEESLQVMANVRKHNERYESTADDAGTSSRNTKYFLQRCLNRHCLMMEVSDYQMAATLLGMPIVLRSHRFTYVDPHASVQYLLNHFVERHYASMNEEDTSDVGSYSEEDEVQTNEEERQEEEELNEKERGEGNLSSDESNEGNADDDQDVSYYQQPQRPNLSVPAEFGFSKIYEVEEGGEGNPSLKLPIPSAAFYYSRGKELEMMNLIEYASLVDMIRKPKEADEEGPEPGKRRGRRARKVFEFDADFELQRLHGQFLRSKQTLPFVIGAPPPKRPGKKPIQLEGEKEKQYQKRIQNWMKKADLFAKYYLLLFRPCGALATLEKEDFTYTALLEWVEKCRQSRDWLSAFRLVMFNNRLNGMSISGKKKTMLAAYRGQNRTIWSDEERKGNSTYFAMLAEQRQNDLDLAGLSAVEYNLRFEDLPDRENRAMAKQEKDISSMASSMSQLFEEIDFNPRRSSRRKRVGNDHARNMSQALNPDLSRSLWLPENDELKEDVVRLHNQNSGTNNFVSDQGSARELTDDQQAVYDKVIRMIPEGNSAPERPPILVNGPAGTGKTVLINSILEAAENQGKYFLRTTFNAINAIAIGAETFSGQFFWKPAIHMNKSPEFNDQELIKFFNKLGLDLPSLQKNFSRIVIGIVVEEHSNFAPEMLSLLNVRLQQVTGSDKPFGGLIVVLVGDLGQLGPVKTRGSLASATIGYYNKVDKMQKTQEIYEQFMRNREDNPGENEEDSVRPPPQERLDRFSPGHPHRNGIDLIIRSKLHTLSTQMRAVDPVHQKNVEHMFSGQRIPFQMFFDYETLKSEDIRKDGDFEDAPVLVSTNRERFTMNGIMAPLKAANRNTCAIRWQAKCSQHWKQKPPEEYIPEIIDRDPCFWEYFVHGAEGFVTDNVCKSLGIVNGARIRYHSLSFATPEVQATFEAMVAQTQIGQVLSLPPGMQPETVNVQLVDLPRKIRQKWKRLMENRQPRPDQITSLVLDKVVIPLSAHRKKKDAENEVLVLGSPNGLYRCSRVRVSNYFPVECGFAITIHKAQGRTLDNVILALSRRHGISCGLDYSAVYVAFSRVRRRKDIRLLLFNDDGSRDSLLYLTKKTGDPCNLAFLRGFDSNGDFHPSVALEAYHELK